MIELMRARLLAEDRTRDVALLAVLAYAGLRPQEALVLEWHHVRERTLLVERAVSDGQLKVLKNRRQPRTVGLLAPLREDLEVRRRIQNGPTAPLFPSASGGSWRASDWRNWRKRVYRPIAHAVGLRGAAVRPGPRVRISLIQRGGCRSSRSPPSSGPIRRVPRHARG